MPNIDTGFHERTSKIAAEMRRERHAEGRLFDFEALDEIAEVCTAPSTHRDRCVRIIELVKATGRQCS